MQGHGVYGRPLIGAIRTPRVNEVVVLGVASWAPLASLGYALRGRGAGRGVAGQDA